MERKENEPAANRSLLLKRTLNAPVSLVWEVWTKPGHISQWWGPDGFTNTISVMDLKPGGEWNLVMHGPDGTGYRNKSIFKDVVPHRRLVYEHVTGPKFTATITFEADGSQTHLTWHMLFETVAEFENTVRTFKADEGLKQNADKLERFLEKHKQH